jgi:hypothetical protein
MARALLYLGWAIGLVAIVLVGADEQLAGALLTPAALLLLAAAAMDVAAEVGFSRRTGALNGLLVLVGAGWLAVGVVLLI